MGVADSRGRESDSLEAGRRLVEHAAVRVALSVWRCRQLAAALDDYWQYARARVAWKRKLPRHRLALCQGRVVRLVLRRVHGPRLVEAPQFAFAARLSDAGLADAARTTWKPTVIRVITNASNADTIKVIHSPSS